jgi:hypothetical protein
LLDGEPRIEDHLAGLDGAIRDQAHTRMVRALAAANRVPDREAVVAGLSANEDSTASVLALGISASRAGELDLARRALEMAVRMWSSTLTNQASAYHSVLARFHLAEVVAKLGDTTGARTHYEAFLRRWGDADRPIPEVLQARRALAALG